MGVPWPELCLICTVAGIVIGLVGGLVLIPQIGLHGTWVLSVSPTIEQTSSPYNPPPQGWYQFEPTPNFPAGTPLNVTVYFPDVTRANEYYAPPEACIYAWSSYQHINDARSLESQSVSDYMCAPGAFNQTQNFNVILQWTTTKSDNYTFFWTASNFDFSSSSPSSPSLTVYKYNQVPYIDPVWAGIMLIGGAILSIVSAFIAYRRRD